MLSIVPKTRHGRVPSLKSHAFGLTLDATQHARSLNGALDRVSKWRFGGVQVEGTEEHLQHFQCPFWTIWFGEEEEYI
jgi:hypothetical protein